MQELVTAIREKIVAEAKGEIAKYGFASNCEEDYLARHPVLKDRADDPAKDGLTWDSWLCVRNGVAIVLKYARERASNAQTVILSGHPFNKVRLVVYDTNEVSANVAIRRQEIAARLAGILDNAANPIYGVQDVVDREVQNRKGDTRAIGHVFNLYLLNSVPPVVWNINDVQNALVRNGLVDKAAATLKALLPAAQSYCDNEGRELRNQA